MAVSELEEADLLRRLEAEKARLRDLDAQIKLLSASRLAARKTIAKKRKTKRNDYTVRESNPGLSRGRGVFYH